MFVYCPCCATNLYLEPFMGNWMRTCLRCNKECQAVVDDERPTLVQLELMHETCPHPDKTAA